MTVEPLPLASSLFHFEVLWFAFVDALVIQWYVGHGTITVVSRWRQRYWTEPPIEHRHALCSTGTRTRRSLISSVLLGVTHLPSARLLSLRFAPREQTSIFGLLQIKFGVTRSPSDSRSCSLCSRVCGMQLSSIPSQRDSRLPTAQQASEPRQSCSHPLCSGVIHCSAVFSRFLSMLPSCGCKCLCRCVMCAPGTTSSDEFWCV